MRVVGDFDDGCWLTLALVVPLEEVFIGCVFNVVGWVGLPPPLSEVDGAVRDDPRPTFCYSSQHMIKDAI